MVNVKTISKLLEEHFDIDGGYKIDSLNLVHVKGDVYFSNNKLEKMPVQFGTIKGGLIINDSNITTLEGSPKLLSGGLTVHNCMNLTTCVGAPEQVNGFVHISKCPLKSLEGFPSICKSSKVDFSFDLPVLRLLQPTQGTGFYLNNEDEQEEAAEIVLNILRDPRWMGKGKSAALNCALELKKAGYAGNARW